MEVSGMFPVYRPSPPRAGCVTLSICALPPLIIPLAYSAYTSPIRRIADVRELEVTDFAFVARIEKAEVFYRHIFHI